MKDAKMDTTVIPAHANLGKPHMRKRNTDLENENYRLKSELSQARRAARLAVLEEMEAWVKDGENQFFPDHTGPSKCDFAAIVVEDFIEFINRMKEAAK